MIRADDLDDLLDRPQAAELMRCSLTTLDRLIARQAIEVVRVGGRGRGRVFVTRRAVLDYLNRQRRPAKSA